MQINDLLVRRAAAIFIPDVIINRHAAVNIADLGGLLDAWDDSRGLILLTSDHGNLEDLSTRRHTDAKVPGLVIGSKSARREFVRGLSDLTHIAPAIKKMFL